jgi:hypothetical protein
MLNNSSSFDVSTIIIDGQKMVGSSSQSAERKKPYDPTLSLRLKAN